MAANENAAVYCRLAYKDDLRIECQKERVLRYALAQGYEKITLYIDNGANGCNFNRTAFKKMNDAINAGEIGAVIVLSIDRIGRNVIEVGNWIRLMEKKGVVLKAADGSFDDDNRLDNVFRDLINDYYNKNYKTKRKKAEKTSAMAT